MSSKKAFQPTIYFEQENFQSINFLKEKFGYPYFDRKLVRPPVLAQAAENDTSKEVTTHSIYLLNSVVCLEDEWSKPFEFVGDAVEEIQKNF